MGFFPGKSFFWFLFIASVVVVSFFKTGSKTFAGDGMNFAVNSFAPENPGKIPCRFNHLTDIVVFEKVKRVVLSDPADFKIEIVKGKSRLHLVVMPLKESASSDLFIFGVNRAHYLRMKTVPPGQRYVTRVEIGASRSAPRP